MRSVVVSMCVFLGTLRSAAAWNSGFLTTFRWSSGSRNARGEMAHSDALTSACLLSLKGSVASFWLCADDFRSARRASHLCQKLSVEECPGWVCAVQRRRFPVGANPIRQPLQPEAIAAANGGNEVAEAFD